MHGLTAVRKPYCYFSITITKYNNSLFPYFIQFITFLSQTQSIFQVTLYDYLIFSYYIRDLIQKPKYSLPMKSNSIALRRRVALSRIYRINGKNGVTRFHSALKFLPIAFLKNLRTKL